jgi:hypothetical protein
MCVTKADELRVIFESHWQNGVARFARPPVHRGKVYADSLCSMCGLSEFRASKRRVGRARIDRKELAKHSG